MPNKTLIPGTAGQETAAAAAAGLQAPPAAAQPPTSQQASRQVSCPVPAASRKCSRAAAVGLIVAARRQQMLLRAPWRLQLMKFQGVRKRADEQRSSSARQEKRAQVINQDNKTMYHYSDRQPWLNMQHCVAACHAGCWSIRSTSLQAAAQAFAPAKALHPPQRPVCKTAAATTGHLQRTELNSAAPLGRVADGGAAMAFMAT